MYEFDDAYKLVLSNTPLMSTHEISIKEGLGCVLAEDAKSKDPIPGFASSAMDGYAVFADEVSGATESAPVTLKIQGEIKAGDAPGDPLEKGCAIKIMTGAVLPEGATAVIKKEDTKDQGQSVNIEHSPSPNENIRKEGEEFKQGATVLHKGALLTPPVIGLLATLGYEKVMVHKKPKVVLLVTGDELLSPTEELSPGKIRDSNSYGLRAALMASGIDQVEVLWAKDVEEDLEQAFNKALEGADVLITSGGVSVGDYDMVRKITEKAEVEEVFWRVAIKPGKPIFFGKKGEKLVFGLPGNPVSVLVSFYKFVKPALKKMGGQVLQDTRLRRAIITKSITKRTDRLEFVRGVLIYGESKELLVRPFIGHGSHMLSGLAQADCLIHFPSYKSEYKNGEVAHVEPIDWGQL